MDPYALSGTALAAATDSASGTVSVRADAFTDWLTSVKVSFGPFGQLSAPIATLVGVVMLAALIHGVILIVDGLRKGGHVRGNAFAESVPQGREDLRRGIFIVVGVPLVTVVILALYRLFGGG